jgi:hypothetical protein
MASLQNSRSAANLFKAGNLLNIKNTSRLPRVGGRFVDEDSHQSKETVRAVYFSNNRIMGSPRETCLSDLGFDFRKERNQPDRKTTESTNKPSRGDVFFFPLKLALFSYVLLLWHNEDIYRAFASCQL